MSIFDKIWDRMGKNLTINYSLFIYEYNYKNNSLGMIEAIPQKIYSETE